MKGTCSFLLEKTYFQKGLGMQLSKAVKSKKVISLGEKGRKVYEAFTFMNEYLIQCTTKPTIRPV